MSLNEGEPSRGRSPNRTSRIALGIILFAALVQSVWNSVRLPALTGYDEAGHVAYILTLVRESRLPHPLEGWSTFHPPFYYAIASLIWRLAEPWGSYPLLIALRFLGVAATLASGAVAFLLVRRQGDDLRTAVVATLLVVFLPFRQLAVTMLGNEGMAAALVALALLFLTDLQRNPGRLGSAIAAGCFAGLALGTKYTALALLPACAVPFLRADSGSRARWAAAAGVLALALVAGPVYARNLALTGGFIPMTRGLEPMRSIEQGYVIRPRHVSDYLILPLGVFRNPSIAGDSLDGVSVPSISLKRGRQTLEFEGALINRNMFTVTGLVYSGVWYDPFGVRAPRLHWIGPVLAALGVIPTLLTIVGFLAATGRMVSTRLRGMESPVTVFSWCALGLFVSFTWTAPSLVAGKASYLLPVGVPAAIFFARGIALVGARVRGFALAASLAAALACGVAFTDGVIFTSHAPHPLTVALWTRVSAFLPGEHIDEAATILGGIPIVNGAP